MIGQNAFGTSTASPSKGRMFLYEVSGMRQTWESDKNNFPIRNSGSTFIKVPYSRMNEEMQRITRLGGQIVSIKPLNSDGSVAEEG
ncbi:phycobilisome linker polypeptide [Oscillatoria sp. CS-180]|uniref:phycobilisome linker polypeptide n=1 Tax=Oscillatoria sp. CS-180 TaxID=3021720 RepID=UPI0023310ABA|nr:phycobilisome linker polypeptide [Oscillatoria sp. CS-180]MDB9529208.1 phycobilisome linker polypeptide [Oscillatoria sp. CS-180]